MSQDLLLWGLAGLAGILGIVLTLKYFPKALLLAYAAFPFYYLPTYLSQNRGNLEFGGEDFWTRAVKDVVLVGVVGIWLIRAVMYKHKAIKLSKLSLALLVYMAFGLVRMANTSLEVALPALRLYIEYSCMFFVARDVFAEEKTIRRLLWAWVLPSIVVSLLGYYEYFSGNLAVYVRLGVEARIISTLFNPNALGWYLMWVNGLAMGLYLCVSGRKWRWFLLSIIVLNSGALVLTGSRSALILATAIVLLGFMRRPSFRTLILGVGIVVGIGLIVVLGQDRFGLEQFRAFNTQNIAGPRTANLAEDLPALANSPEAILWGWGDLSLYPQDAMYLGVLFSGGLIGSAIMGGILLLILYDLLLIHLRGHPWHYPLLFSTVGVLAVGFVGSTFIIFPMAVFFWSEVGIIDRLVSNRLHR